MNNNYFLSACCAVLAMLIVSCGEEQAVPDTAVADSGVPSESNVDSAAVEQKNPWLSERYGPESGTVRLEVHSGGQKTEQVRYFARHGERDALYWFFGDSEGAPAFITIVDDEQIITRGPGDSAATRMPWRQDVNTTFPNFRNLTTEMRELYGLQELPPKTVLGKECVGYRLKTGPMLSNVWVWEGIMMYGEIQGTADGKVAPILVKVVELDTVSTVPETVFAMPE